MKKKTYKMKWKNLIFLLLLILFILCFIFSIYNITKWKLDSNKTNKQVNEIYKKVKINETKDNEKTKIIEQNENIDKSNSYWNYIKMKLISVNFKNLKSINSSTVAWLKVNGTNINYPVVQGNDNEYYLTHSFNKKYNKAGWVFLDYRNNIKYLDKNNIIYSHARQDTTMFGTLKNIIKSDWYNNKDNYIIKLSTEYENTLWQVFSVYKINSTNDYLKIYFNNNTEFKNFTILLKNRSAFNFNTDVNETDKIITLSTCYNKTKKVVMHAKLIKIEKR